MDYKKLSKIPDSLIADAKKLKTFDKVAIKKFLESGDVYDPLELSNGMKLEVSFSDYGFKLYAVEVIPGETVWDDVEKRHLLWNTGDSLEDMDMDELASVVYEMIQNKQYLEE